MAKTLCALTYGYGDICEKPFRKISERTVYTRLENF